MSVLTKIQTELKAPKNRTNKFGGYKYRSCEDILEAVKPLLAKHDATLAITDEITEVGGRVYVKATVALRSGEEEYRVSAFAREAESKKGMDDSQVTGTASSYARKYALNGLFLIDDTKDADTDEYKAQMDSAATITAEKAKTLETLLSMKQVTVDTIYQQYRVSKLTELSEDQYTNIVRRLEKSGGNRKDS